MKHVKVWSIGLRLVTLYSELGLASKKTVDILMPISVELYLEMRNFGALYHHQLLLACKPYRGAAASLPHWADGELAVE